MYNYTRIIITYEGLINQNTSNEEQIIQIAWFVWRVCVICVTCVCVICVTCVRDLCDVCVRDLCDVCAWFVWRVCAWFVWRVRDLCVRWHLTTCWPMRSAVMDSEVMRSVVVPTPCRMAGPYTWTAVLGVRNQNHTLEPTMRTTPTK